MILKRVGCFLVTYIANGIVFAEHDSMELFAVYHGHDLDEFSDWTTESEYFTERVEAEWEFCTRAFEWLQDVVRTETAEVVEKSYLDEAKTALSRVGELVKEMFEELADECTLQVAAAKKNAKTIDEMFKIVLDNANNAPRCEATDLVSALDNASEVIGQTLREEHGIKESTPQEVAAECNGNISFAIAAAVNFEKMLKRKVDIMLSRYAEAVKDLDDNMAKLDDCRVLRDTAAKLTKECVASILANIRDTNALFF